MCEISYSEGMIQHTLVNRNWKEDLWAYLPDGVRALLESVDAYGPLEELRLRANAPVQLRFTGYERLLFGKNGSAPMGESECQTMLQRLCGQSVYAWETELGGGFMTLEGGYRVGLSGRFAYGDGGVPRLTDVTGFNFRIARQVPGAAGRVLPSLLDANRQLLPTLVVSPPGCGKTTLLRDITRCCSNGLFGARPMRVALVDTRYELSGSVRGVPQLDVGFRTDVLCGAKKAEGMRMMVTNMSPDVLVTDELSTFEDARAAYDAISCGVAVAASAHSMGAEGLANRRVLAALLQQRLFSRIVVLGRSQGVGTIEQVLDSGFQPGGQPGWKTEEVSACCVRLLS